VNGLVLDTHAAVWYLQASSKLSAPSLAAIQACLAAGKPVFVSTVTIVELTYLVEKGRFPTSLLDQLLLELQRPAPELLVAPLDLLTASTLRTVPTSIRDMPDRMIAATAVALGMSLVTRDQQLQTSGIPTLW
jgi:PIN domain nuclease of toxin-antitoxin system